MRVIFCQETSIKQGLSDIGYKLCDLNKIGLNMSRESIISFQNESKKMLDSILDAMTDEYKQSLPDLAASMTAIKMQDLGYVSIEDVH